MCTECGYHGFKILMLSHRFLNSYLFFYEACNEDRIEMFILGGLLILAIR